MRFFGPQAAAVGDLTAPRIVSLPHELPPVRLIADLVVRTGHDVKLIGRVRADRTQLCGGFALRMLAERFVLRNEQLELDEWKRSMAPTGEAPQDAERERRGRRRDRGSHSQVEGIANLGGGGLTTHTATAAEQC